MKKLRLESLDVTSFETLSVKPGERGTVQGHDLVSRPPRTDPSGLVTLCAECAPSTPGAECTFTCTQFLNCGGTIIVP